MRTRYVAYGLELRSSFELPGMTPCQGGGLPPLDLNVCDSREIDAIWSGHDGSPAWQGTLGDGSPLRIETGTDGDTLFTYGECARYLLDSTHGTLSCQARQDDMRWRQTLLARILPNVGLAHGYEALHASAVQSPAGGVLAVAAPSGMGKTTVSLELVQRGWPLVTDDVLILAEHSGQVRAQPGSPHMNVAPSRAGGATAKRVAHTIEVLGGEHWMSVRNVVREQLPVRVICLLQRSTSLSLDAQVLPASPLPLVPYMLGLRGDQARERRRFSLYANLADSATIVRLTAGADDRPAQLADRLERVLDERAEREPS